MAAILPVNINGVEFDALIEETLTLDADIPTYPVETGFEVSDSIILKPQSLSLVLFLTNTPVTHRAKASPSHVQDVIKQLEGLYFGKMPVAVTTPTRSYPSMGITSISLPKNLELGSSCEVSIDLQEIRFTEAQTTTLPDSYGMSGTTGTNAGTANITASTAPNPLSAITEALSGSTDNRTLLISGLNAFGIMD